MTSQWTTNSALALVLMTLPAAASEWEVRVGGEMEQYLAYANSDVGNLQGEKLGGVDSKLDAEIEFAPSLTLDNGIKIGASIVLNAFTSSDQIDTANLRIDGAFGMVVLGSEDSAGYEMFYAGPDVTFVNVNSGSLTAFIPFSGEVTGTSGGVPNTTLAVGSDIFYGTLGTTFLENGGDASESAQRFTYYTPRIGGFQIGASYARDANADSNVQVDLDQDPLHNIFDLGANYIQEFGDFDIALAGRWGIASDDASNLNPTIYAAGLQMGYAGFRIGGSFAEQNNTARQDGQSFDAGASYETGPWGFSFTYMHGRNVNDENFGIDVAGISGGNETLAQYLVGVRYDLAEGVTLNGFGAYVNFEESAGDAGTGTPGDDVEGFVVGTGVKITF